MMADDDVMEIPDFTESSNDPDRFTCEVCDTPLTYSGRGRYPRFCDDHKPVRSSSPGATRRAPKGVAQIKSGMQQLYDLAGDGFDLLGKYTEDEALCLDGFLIKQRSEVLAQQWADLAERDPKVKELLMQTTTGSSWGGVIITHVMLIGAIAMNHKKNGKPRVPREKRPPRNLRTVPTPQSQPRPQPSPTVANGEQPIVPGYTPGPDALFESGS